MLLYSVTQEFANTTPFNLNTEGKKKVRTRDAAGSQKDIAQVIVDQGADYVLALKKNHSTLYEDVTSYNFV